jgi:cytochrome c-type biogenesis protein CcmH/NrfG
VAVRPTISCGSCGATLSLSDKFCAKCGTAVQWDLVPDLTVENTPAPSTVICPSCGIPNAFENAVCSGCGSPLRNAASASRAKAATGKRSGDAERIPERRVQGKKKFESWQVLSIAGVVVVAALVAIGVFRNPPKEATPQEQAAESNAAPAVSPTLVSDIEALQKTVDANPKDAETILRLANALHDAKFMPRAIAMYQRYLQLKPKDADARVDMGICYYESGDSPTALKEMQTALSYDPKHQMAMFNLGIVTLNQGNLALSNEWFKKTVEVNPNTQIGQRAQQILTQHSTIKQ